MFIQSAKNERVKQWKKLSTKKERDKSRLYRIEGFHLLEEAIRSQAEIVEIMLLDGIETDLVKAVPEEHRYVLSEEAAKAVSGTENSQGVFAIIRKSETTTWTIPEKPVLLLDRIQDPGNMGTMIRTADAAGFGKVVVGEGCVDVYNDKTIRSAQGSHFHLEIHHQKLEETMNDLKKLNMPVYGTALDKNAKSFRSVSPTGPFGLIMGNEGNGMDEFLLQQTTQNLYIPILGRAESLNVGVAAGILMFSLWKGNNSADK